ncbi:hypothetical protein NA57DRAFT_79234 [Rhizodiscina lignyota]|uniref:Uncharacterized protein n=1 Tax=Rhizodiscina lignyota TaxID=1504668 RepID=A0A9P4I9A1_9PEZI|nr:hypothetical protein NA57DRAFT_79234 [Rhizodiscina lignyota]
MASLPIELILDIIDALAPDEHDAPVALPAYHPITKTLLSFTTVCRATHSRARRHLYTRCLYIDSSRRLRLLLLALGVGSDEFTDGISQKQLDIRPLLTSLYLAPFPPSSIDDLPVAIWVYELMCILRSSLKRLVIDMDLRSIMPWQDHLYVRPKLRAAFEQLEDLEEFTSTRDELSLDHFLPNVESIGSPLWTKWQRLRKVSLYGAPCGIWMMHNNFRMPQSLTHMVLTCPSVSTNPGYQELLMARTSRKLRILIIDESTITEHRNALNSFNEHSIRAISDEPPIDLVGIDLPIGMTMRSEGVDEVTNAYQEWVRDEAISGNLWNLGGLFLGERREALVHELT